MSQSSALITAMLSVNKSAKEALLKANNLVVAAEAIIRTLNTESNEQPIIEKHAPAPTPETEPKADFENRELNAHLKPEEVKILDAKDRFLIQTYNAYSPKQKMLLKEFIDSKGIMFSEAAENATKKGDKVPASYVCALLKEAVKKGILLCQTPNKKTFRRFKLAPAINHYLKEQQKKYG